MALAMGFSAGEPMEERARQVKKADIMLTNR